jgi:hypothetical protein
VCATAARARVTTPRSSTRRRSRGARSTRARRARGRRPADGRRRRRTAPSPSARARAPRSQGSPTPRPARPPAEAASPARAALSPTLRSRPFTKNGRDAPISKPPKCGAERIAPNASCGRGSRNKTRGRAALSARVSAGRLDGRPPHFPGVSTPLSSRIVSRRSGVRNPPHRKASEIFPNRRESARGTRAMTSTLDGGAPGDKMAVSAWPQTLGACARTDRATRATAACGRSS